MSRAETCPRCQRDTLTETYDYVTGVYGWVCSGLDGCGLAFDAADMPGPEALTDDLADIIGCDVINELLDEARAADEEAEPCR